MTSTMTSYPLQKTSSSDQLAAIAYFLDELELKTPIRPLQRETDGNTALLDTINSLVAVGAFIAGVQAQLIGITSGSNRTALGRATNWFAFAGLTLDLIGTSAGVARALLLQASIRRTHRLVVRLTGQIDGARHKVHDLQQRGVDLSANPRARTFLTRSVRAISRVVALLAEDGRFGVQSAEEITEIEAAGAAALEALDSSARKRGPKHLHLFRAMWLRKVVLPHVHVEGLGYIPVASLTGGTLCLFVSVVLYAAASQPRAVWISCAAIFVCMLTSSLVPTTNSHKRKRAVLYNRVEEELQQCPPVEPPMYPSPEEKDSDAL